MKRTLVTAILGIAASVASSYGQGAIQFQTYTSHGGSGLLTTFAPGVPGYPVGPVNSDFSVSVAWSFTAVVDPAGTGLVSSGLTNSPANTAIFQLSTGNQPGYYQGPNFALTTYTAGTPVFFQVFAWQTADGSYDLSDIRGKSAVFSHTLATGIDAPGTMDNLQPWTVGLVPEPSTMALAGLGLASLLAFRRRS